VSVVILGGVRKKGGRAEGNWGKILAGVLEVVWSQILFSVKL